MENVLEADDLWDGFPEDLERLRVKMLRNLYLDSLETLCLQKIVQNIDYHKYDFHYLPPILMSSLQAILRSNHDIDKADVMPFFIGENIDKVYLNLGTYCWMYSHKTPGVPIAVSSLLDSIAEVGEVATRALHVKFSYLSTRLAPTVNMLCDTISHLSNLRCLSLSCVSLNDSAMAVIGSSCPELRVLIFNVVNSTTDKGIEFLCKSSPPHGVCTKLTHLVLEHRIKVTVSGLVTALLHLPHLVVLDHRLTYQAVHKINTIYGIRAMELEKITITDTTEDISNNETKLVKTILPKLKTLNINTTSIENFEISHFYHLENLQNIQIKSCSNLLLNDCHSLFIHYGEKLVKIEILDNKSQVDVSIIGFNCMNVKEFKFQSETTEDCQYELDYGYNFSSVAKCELLTIVPDSIFKCFLASRELTILGVGFELSPFIITWLLQEARINYDVFSNVTSLNLKTYLTLEEIKILVTLAPKLHKFYMNWEYFDEMDVFRSQYGLKYRLVFNADHDSLN